MTRQAATEFLRLKLNEHGLSDWGVRLNQSAESRFLGMCLHKDKVIVMSAHHIDIHPDPDVRNTILHEVAHALTPGHGHDDTWAAKAREIGCDNTMPCSNLSLNPEVIDAIRSGATVEVTFEEQVIRTPRFVVTRLQDKCEVCGKVAKMASEMMEYGDEMAQFDVKVTTLECGHIVRKNIPRGTPFHLFQRGGDPTCVHTWNKNSCTTCGRFRPYTFQLDGMRAIEAGLAVNKGFGCFDEMGLGKTNQAMGAIFYHPELLKVAWVVKSGLKYQFQQVMLDWMGEEHYPQVVESSKDWLIPKLNHYIIGYDMLVPKVRTLKSGKTVTSGFDISQFDRVGIKTVVLDECQQIKNADSSRTQMVRKVVKTRKVIALSGTPWKNRGSELYPVLNMLDPTKFSSYEGFKRQWVDTYWQGNVLKEGGIRRIPQFREYTKDLCIRRERAEVMPELPATNRTKLYIKMDLNQQAEYDAAVDEFVQWYDDQMGQLSGMAIIAAMQRMRHIVGMAKVPATEEYVDEFVENTDRKLVVFAHHKDCQLILFDDLKMAYDQPDGKRKRVDGSEVERIPVFQITSDMDAQDRYNVQVAFNNAPRALMVASQLAAGEGLNLQTCCDCFMHERQWNPQNEQQCEDRFARIGQASTFINAVYGEMQGITTIDPQIDSIVEGKRFRFHAWGSDGEAPRWNEDAFMKELADVIVRAHKARRAA